MRRLLIALGVLFPATSWAYPQYIAKGYTTCFSCHYDPTGGGLLNSYGHATNEATLSLTSWREALKKNDVSGFDDQHGAALQWDIGLDTRFLFLESPRNINAQPSLTTIPMLIEGGGVLALGPVMAYATVTTRRDGPDRTDLKPFSREHWLGWRINDEWMVRAGRIVLPFGIKMPDHTQYTRQELGFDQWGQSYALEVDRITEQWSVSLAPFAGDLLLDPKSEQQRGAAGSFAYQIPSRISIGGSFMGSMSDLSGHAASGVTIRLRGLQRTYAMGEADLRYRWGRKDPMSQYEVIGYGRLGWFVQEWLDLYFEWGGRRVLDEYNLTKYRYTGGMNWQVMPWMELMPQVVYEETVETGMDHTVLVQLHVIY